MNWGIIGCGAVVAKSFLPGLKASKEGRLLAIAGRDESRTKIQAEALGVKRYYIREEEILSDKEIAVIYIATPPHLHFRQMVQCANAGKHILVEKPMALLSKECENAIEIARIKKVKIMVCYYMRFNGRHQKAKELLKDGVIGDFSYVRINNSTYYPPVESAWRYKPEISGGGALVDIGSHCIDLLRYLIGEIVEVAGFYDNNLFHSNIEEISCAIVKFENGGYGTITNSFTTPKFDTEHMNSFEIYGTKGHILSGPINVQNSEGILKVFAEDGVQEWTSSQMTHQAVIDSFEDSIRNDTIPLVTGFDGMRVQQIIESVYKSNRLHQFVKVR